MASKKPSGLGRGLGALLGDDVLKTETAGALYLPISEVESNSSQPRKNFDEEALAQLADSILVPVQGEYYALEGLSDLMNTVRIVRRSLNPRLELEGGLLTMFDGRTNLALQVAEEVKHYFPGKVYATVIPRNVRLSEAPSHGKPITAYDRTSRGAEAYTAFAAEFLNKQ